MARSDKKNRKKKQGAKQPVLLSPSSRPAKPLFRLIPLTMCMAGALLVLKTVEIYQNGRSLHEELFVSSVIAQDKAEATPEEAEKAETAPAEDAKTQDAEAEESAHAEAEEAGEEGAAEPEVEVPVDYFESRDKGYSQRELDILESLGERREKLEKLERDVALREKVLQATEARIDEKIAEMNTMSTELKELLVTYDKEEDAKISSLVKVYETMKPKDAARIFDELDMDILLLVADRMSERRIAPILAGMSPQKAKDLTQELAAQQRSRPDAAEEGMIEDPNYSPPLF